MTSDAVFDTQAEKVKTNLSVAQLGCFIRLCIESDIFPKENKKQLISVFANNFSTTNRTNLSYGSLKNHQYQPENSAIDKLKSTILKQLKLLQENNFKFYQKCI